MRSVGPVLLASTFLFSLACVPEGSGSADAGSDGGQTDAGHVFVDIAPRIVGLGREVVVTVTAVEPLEGCEVQVGGEPAGCAPPSDRTCRCTWFVGVSGPEGELLVEAVAVTATDTARVSAPLVVDRTPPFLDGALVSVARRPLGQDDEVVLSPGAAEDPGADYPGKSLSVRVWSAADDFDLLATGAADAAAIVLPGTDGSSPDTLAPASIWLSAMDAAGNETARAFVESGRDLEPPFVTAGALVLEAGAPGDKLFVAPWAITDLTSAVREVRVRDPDTGRILAIVPPPTADALAEVRLDTSGAAAVWVEADDKVGHQSDRVRVELLGSCTTADQCEAWQLCAEGTCAVYDPSGGCSADEDCPRDHYCDLYDGQCQGCVVDADCAASPHGPRCDDSHDGVGPGPGYCARDCGPGLPDCPEPLVCDEEAGGVCVQGCTTRLDCEEGLICKAGYLCAACESSSQCDSSEICDDAGRCVENPGCMEGDVDLCTQDVGLAYFCDPVAQQCVFGCTASGCDPGDAANCNPCATGSCNAETRQCTDEPCPSGCLDPMTGAPADCAAQGLICDPVTCQCTVPGGGGGSGEYCDACINDSDCIDGYVCEGGMAMLGLPGQCYQSCSADNQCTCEVEGTTCRVFNSEAIGTIACLQGARGVCQADAPCEP